MKNWFSCAIVGFAIASGPAKAATLTFEFSATQNRVSLPAAAPTTLVNDAVAFDQITGRFVVDLTTEQVFADRRTYALPQFDIAQFIAPEPPVPPVLGLVVINRAFLNRVEAGALLIPRPDGIVLRMGITEIGSGDVVNSPPDLVSSILALQDFGEVFLAASVIENGFNNDDVSSFVTWEITDISIVPLPAAGWLLVTGVMALVTVSHRRS